MRNYGKKQNNHSKSASKAYQINYTEALNKSNTKIYITDIRPGLVDTAMAKGEGLFWVMPVKEVAKQITKAIKGKKHIAVITKRWQIIAFILKHLPWSIYKRM